MLTRSTVSNGLYQSQLTQLDRLKLTQPARIPKRESRFGAGHYRSGVSIVTPALLPTKAQVVTFREPSDPNGWTGMTDQRLQLDHIIILLPSLAADHLNLYRDAGFEVFPGGQHADKVTENCLIVLPDGVYLELIAFTGGVDEAKRSAHWWGNKQEGLIDWAFLPGPLNADDRVACINRAANSTIYDAPIHGGRTTKEGKKLRWAVAFPLVDENRERRGVLPFFCGDITPRDWRVPERSERHPNGAVGIAAIHLLSKTGGVQAYRQRLSQILSPAPDSAPYQFDVTTPGGSSIHVFLKEPETEEEISWIKERGEGLFKLSLGGGAKSGATLGASEGCRIDI